MEIRLSVVLLAVLLLLGSALSASEPTLSSAPDGLLELEDAVALDRGNLELTRDLAGTYLRTGHPGLAIAAVRAAPPELARDAMLTHRLAQAYEATGRVDDALATAQLAHARCLCALRGSEMCTNIPRCTGSTLAALEMHEEALSMLVRWGVDDPRHDGRTGLAYKLAQRTARIASLGLNENTP
ncbi:MAG TPA: hypothetical protein VHM19_07045 [Polyangiales bacterium]|jgi:hypothetical protein|nr:hypothetical protein [Polyangiales bacterium]